MAEKLSSFEEVGKNNFLSNVLIMFFFIFIGIIGTVIGYAYGDMYFGLGLTLFIGFIYFLIMMAAGNDMVLSMTGAHPVTKKDYPHLYHAVEGMTIAAGLKSVPKCYVIDDSALNAFATGTNENNYAIAVTTGLMEKLKREELEGVIAHEMAHIKNQDVKYMLYVTIFVGFITLLSDFLLRSFLWGGKGGRRDSKDGRIGLVLIIVGIALAILSPIVTQLIRLAISRKKEYAADAGAVIITRYPMGLANALRKIKSDPDPLVDNANKATAHLFISSPFRNVSNLLATHPPIDDRIKRLEAM